MAATTDTLRNFINGEFVDTAEGATEAIVNPATGHIFVNYNFFLF